MSTDLVTTAGTHIIQRDHATESLIREQFGLQNATTTEIDYFFAACNRMGLDPLQKQIYAIMRKDKRTGREVLTLQVSIDGFRSIAARTKEYAGSDDVVFSGGDPMTPEWKATATVYRIVQGVRCPFTASARWKEYVQQFGQWATKPHVMLAKCAEALALRKAFPAELGGVYTPDEMPLHGDTEEHTGLAPGQASCLRDLSKRAGIADALAEVRIGNMRANEYDLAVEKLEQRIREQETVAAAQAEKVAPCVPCSGSGEIDGDPCGLCGGTGEAQ